MCGILGGVLCVVLLFETYGLCVHVMFGCVYDTDLWGMYTG